MSDSNDAKREGSELWAMHRARWHKLEPHVDALLDMHDAQRSQYLRDLGDDDASLSEELREMLATQNQPLPLLDVPVTTTFASLFEEAPVAAGTMLAGRYRIIREIGRGGMALVYLAADMRHGRNVAIKVVHRDLVALLGSTRFLAEIRTTAQLQHPHILTLHDSGEEQGIPFYVMPFAEGGSLRQRLDEHGPLPLHIVVDIATAVAGALDTAHRKGVVHRDIKPENILFHEGAVLLADFGIAITSAAPATSQESRMRVGTPQYMSPEQATANSPVDGRSDIYALATVVFEMIDGVPPFQSRDAATVLAERAHVEPPRLRASTGHNSALADVLARALSRSPSDRQVSAGAFATELRAVLHEEDQLASIVPIRNDDHSFLRSNNGRTHSTLWSVGKYTFLAVTICAAVGYGIMRNTSVDRFSTAIAILPMHTQRTDSATLGIAKGLTGVITDAIARRAGVRVINPTSAALFGRSILSPALIADSLGAGTLLSGDLELGSEQDRITLKLLDASGSVRWSQSFDAQTGRLSDLQDSIAVLVAQRLALAKPAPTTMVQRKAHRPTLQVYEYYQRGRNQLDISVDPRGLQQAIDFFERAIAADTLYAEAYAGLSAAHGMLGTGNVSDVAATLSFSKARNAALRALALDPELPEAYAALGLVQVLHDFDWTGADKSFNRARQINPYYARSPIYPAVLYEWRGDFARAVQESRDIVSSEPFSVSSRTELGRALFFAGDYKGALTQLDSAYHRDSTFARIFLTRGEIYTTQRRYPEAIQEFTKLRTATPRSAAPHAFLAFAYARSGQDAKANEHLDSLLARSREQRSGAFYLAIAYAGMRNYNEAFKWLDKSQIDRSMRPLIMDPTFAEFRKDPRFAQAMRKMGLLQ